MRRIGIAAVVMSPLASKRKLPRMPSFTSLARSSRSTERARPVGARDRRHARARRPGPPRAPLERRGERADVAREARGRSAVRGSAVSGRSSDRRVHPASGRARLLQHVGREGEQEAAHDRDALAEARAQRPSRAGRRRRTGRRRSRRRPPRARDPSGERVVALRRWVEARRAGDRTPSFLAALRKGSESRPFQNGCRRRARRRSASPSRFASTAWAAPWRSSPGRSRK